ncbi:MAG: alpha-amylase family glycosyl hydrolase, partial [Planctomycetota bacterium]
GNYGTDLLTPMAFDAVITKPWEFAARAAVSNRNASGLYSAMAATVSAIPAGKTAVAETNDHDSNRLASDFNSSNQNTMNGRQKVAAAILFTQPFPPNIYFGDEIGMKGAKAATGTDADDIPMREPFKWKAVAGAPMSNYPAVTAGTKPPTYSANNDGRSVEEQKGVSGSILETYRSLIAVRKASVALRRGAYTPVTCPDAGVFAFVRSDPAETVLVAINLGSGSTTTSLDLSAFTVPTSGTSPTSLENGATLAAITSANKAAYPITLGARSWAIVRASLSLPVVVTHPDIDGRNLPADAGETALIATQGCLSSFGDNAGELDQLFVRKDGDALRVSISGNLPQDGTSLDLFIDVDPGAGTGQNRLVTAHLPAPPGGLAPLDGTTFDAGFQPDALYYLNTVGGMVYLDRVSLPSPGGTLASKDFRGAVGLGTGRGTLSGGSNPNGVELALDVSNTAGITATSVAGAPTATTGLELRVPFADLGLPAGFDGTVGVAAFLQRVDSVASNQWLPPLPLGSGDLALAPNLGAAAGQQFALVSLGMPGDLDASGSVDAGDLAVLLLDYGPCGGCASDLDGSGSVDFGDVALLLLLFN